MKPFSRIRRKAGNSNRRRLGIVLPVALAFSVFVSGIALADNVQNNVTVGGNDTFVAGGSTSISYRIVATSGDGQTGCNASDGSPAVVTINTPAGVTASPNPLTFNACSTFQPTTFSSSTPGNYSITVSVSDPGPGTYNTSPAAFTLKVLAPPDTTPPVISSNVSGTLGDNGWYTSDVNVSWSVSDPESAISSTSGCGPATISADTAGQSFTCTATSLGGTNTQSVTIKRDATAPTISGSASPAPNGSGWNNTDVSVSFTCADNLSGVASCGPNQRLGGEGAGQSASGTAVDHAGNSASDTVSGINIDKTAPSVSVTGVASGATYTLGSVPAAGCDTSDSLSGVETAASLSQSGGPVGSVTATCSGALDSAGNAGPSASVTYSVNYSWSGFLRPVDNLPTINVVKAGTAVPVKFSLSGNHGLDIFAAGWPKSVAVPCDATAPADAVDEIATPGSSGLSYEASSDQYTYVWKTTKTWSGCRQLQVKLADGQTYMATFRFTK